MEATSYPDNPALEVYVTYKQFDKRLIYWDFCQTSTKKNREDYVLVVFEGDIEPQIVPAGAEFFEKGYYSLA